MVDRTSRIFSRDFVLLLIGNFLVVSIYFLLMTTMAYYVVASFGVESSIAGLAASIFLVGAVAGRIVCGRFAQGFGPKHLGVIALVVQLAMCLLYLVDGLGVGVLIAIRLVHGLSFGVTNTVLPALAVDTLPRDRIGEGTGYFMLSNSLGVGIGPLMSVLVVIGFEYSLLFVICVALSAVALVATMLVKAPRPLRRSAVPEAPDTVESADAQGPEGGRSKVRGHDRTTPARRGSFATAVASIIDTSTFKFSVFMFLVAFAYSSLNAFLNSYAIDQGMGMYAPFVFLVYSITLVVSRLCTGRLQDRFGDNSVLYPSIASMGVGLVLAAFATTPVALLACGVFMATGFGTCMSVGQAAAMKMTTCGDTSRTISTFFLLCDGGCGIGPFMLGFLVSGAGYRTMYLVCAAIAFGAVLYYHFVHGRKDRSRARGARRP